MSGGRIVERGPAPSHYCEPPPLWHYKEPRSPLVDGLPDFSDIIWERIGTVWECDCGETWIVRWTEGLVGRNWAEAPHSEWQRETKRERKQRFKRAENAKTSAEGAG